MPGHLRRFFVPVFFVYQFSVCLFNGLERLEAVVGFVNQKGRGSEEAEKQNTRNLPAFTSC